jgi:serine-type D-Ala-D-Ala carboxypeptidase (penicillin-binding protein 5/6)
MNLNVFHFRYSLCTYCAAFYCLKWRSVVKSDVLAGRKMISLVNYFVYRLNQKPFASCKYQFLKIFNFLLLLVFIQPVAAIPLDLDVSAESAILINADTGAILFEKNARQQLYPASITKVATALYTLHVYQDKLDTMIKAEHDAVASIAKEAKKRSNYTLPAHWLEPGATHIGIKRNEVLSLRDLLNGMLISSGNDASNVIAQYIGGSVSNFMEDLNLYLKEIGCSQTNFCNPHGLHHPKHVTTAYDMAVISMKAMKYPVFREIVKTVRFTRPKTNKQSPTTLIQTNRLLRKGKSHYNKAIGIKTGWTSDAMSTLVASAEYKGRTLIAVLIRVKEREKIFQEAKMLFETAFNQPLVQRVLLRTGPQRYVLKHPEASKPVRSYLKNDVCLDFYPAEEPNLKCNLKWLSMNMPVAKDQHVGDMLISNAEGKLLQTVPLFAVQDVRGSWNYWLKSFFVSKNTSLTNSELGLENSSNGKFWKILALLAASFLLVGILWSMRKKV